MTVAHRCHLPSAINAKWQRAISNNATPVKISARHSECAASKRTALRFTRGRAIFGTRHKGRFHIQTKGEN